MPKELGNKMTLMQDYMLNLKRAIGYESLKAAYSSKYPALCRGDGSSESNITNDSQDIREDTDESSSIIEEKDKEIAQLQKELEEIRESGKASDMKAHQAKRSSDLARNKISTATECLNMYLAESVKKEYFDEFNH